MESPETSEPKPESTETPTDQPASGPIVESDLAPNPNAPQPTSSRLASFLMEFFKGLLNWVVVPVLVVLVLHNFIFQAFHVVGTSMVPTLHDADYLIVSKVGDSLSHIEGKPYIPHRGEVIVFHYPKDPSLIFIKRVIGLPGDHVIVKDGLVTIYNSAHSGGYDPDVSLNLDSPPTLGDFDDTVPADSVFVLGDNRSPNGSFDSREWGFLPTKDIIGHAIFRLLPLNAIGGVSSVQAGN